MADTRLSIEEIEIGLALHFDIRKNIIVPNVSWGLLNHEADLLILSKSGYLTEVEIKRSWTDFLADFKKGHGHKDKKIMYRYYAVPKSIHQKCADKLREADPYRSWGLITYDDTYGDCYVNIEYVPSNHGYHSADKKLYLEEQLQLARLGALRIWGLKRKIIDSRSKISIKSEI